MESRLSNPPLLVVVGETASGKSALALRLAEWLQQGEIICADSWTVRREVDIGTAKPTIQERRQVPHHLLDVVAPCGDFSAAVFKRLANKAIVDIASKGKVPIMVGGTGLYVDSVVYDYTFLPAPPKEQRSQLNTLTIDQLLGRIKQLGLSLDGVDIRNKRRLMRVLEADGARPSRNQMRQNTLMLGISLSREVLRQRVVARTAAMVERGLEEEVRRLADAYGWECEALKGIGYKEWREYFAGVQSLEQTMQRITKNTLDLAKRQRTWFRRNPDINWICNFEDSVDLVTTFMRK